MELLNQAMEIKENKVVYLKAEQNKTDYTARDLGEHVFHFRDKAEDWEQETAD